MVLHYAKGEDDAGEMMHVPCGIVLQMEQEGTQDCIKQPAAAKDFIEYCAQSPEQNIASEI